MDRLYVVIYKYYSIFHEKLSIHTGLDNPQALPESVLHGSWETVRNVYTYKKHTYKIF